MNRRKISWAVDTYSEGIMQEKAFLAGTLEKVWRNYFTDFSLIKQSWGKGTKESGGDNSKHTLILIEKWLMISVTRWIDYSSIFGQLHQHKVAQRLTKFAKVHLRLGQKLNESSKNSQRLLRFCQSGKISPNQVTL